jgi:glycosyltransferase XagB
VAAIGRSEPPRSHIWRATSLSALGLLCGALSLPFVGIASLRLFALVHFVIISPMKTNPKSRPIADAELPIYTILVPLFREGRVLPSLVRALSNLDYPKAKLDIKIILESLDEETQAVARRLALQPPFDVIVVPDREPRTKPKALNYALQFAKGSYVAVFDAEDIPEASQLRKAVSAFANGTARLGCVQANLVIDNARSTWLINQFALEYLTLFEGLLPALEWLQMPMPLGGTSNHFPLSVLREVGGWDPFNVTEDADLGIRLARHGYTCAMIPSLTLEEAPDQPRIWITQRTRWLKGWLQTYIVHLREPVRLVRELGLLRTLGFHALMGGMVISTLVYPIFLLLVSFQLAFDWPSTGGNDSLNPLVLQIAVYNLVTGFGASMLLSLACAIHRGRSVVSQPYYWLLISLAGYRAAFQLFYAPFKWEKTEHGLVNRASRTPTQRPSKAFAAE